MKQKKNRSLSLNKQTVSMLDDAQASALRGGQASGGSIIVASTFCATDFTRTIRTRGCATDFTRPPVTSVI